MMFYHGTTEENGKRIEEEGFVPDKKYNWNVKSKKGFVYLSTAYAPFYAMNAKGKGTRLALVKVEVECKDLYPEDDYLMLGLTGKPVYTQEELDKVDFERYRMLWPQSLHYLGNVAARPDKVKVIGVRYFDGKRLIHRCDPVVSPINFKIMGKYYEGLSDWLYEGKDVMDYQDLTTFFMTEAEG